MHTEVAIHSMNAYVWCWSKVCGTLDEIPSVTMGSCKSKILNEFRDIARTRLYRRSYHLHPLTNVPTQYQIPIPYGFRDIARKRLYRSRSLRQGQRSNHSQTMTLHTYTSNQCPYHISTSNTFRFLRYSPNKIFKLKVTTTRSKVKSR